MPRFYQVYDAVDPAATDSYHETEQQAMFSARTMVDPQIAVHKVGIDRRSIIEALRQIPKRNT
jgi:hypothetical protein